MQQFRKGARELKLVKSDNGKVRMSVSSEEPVYTEIYYNGNEMYALEILDHSAGSIDMARAIDGLVVLDGHKGDQVGLMDVAIIDRKLVGEVTFCAGDRAKNIEQDALSGLRRNVSVGYQVDTSSYQIEGEQDGIPVVRAMSWMPYEASFVPIPADKNVGVGRSQNDETPLDTAKQEKERKMEAKDIAKLYERAAKYGVELEKVAELLEGENARAELDALIVERQAEAIKAREDELKKEREAAEAKAREEAKVKPEAPQKSEEREFDVNIEVKKERKYSVMNVVRSMAGERGIDVGFERELSDELVKRSGKSACGIIIPHAALAQRDFTVAGTSSASVSTDLMAGDFIDVLRTKSVLGQAGVQFMTGLQGNVAIPKMSSGCTGYWVAESTAITESQPTLGQVTGTPHTCGVMTDISRRLLLQSSPSAEAMVRNEIIQRIIRTIQIAVFAGTGADGQPSAITNASGINNPSVTAGTPTFAEILNFPGSIMSDNADVDGQKWIMTGEVWAKLAATDVGTGTDRKVLDYASETMLAKPYLVTEDVPANSLWYGDWSSVVVGVWGNGIDLTADTSTLSSQGALRLVGLQDVDVMVRLGQALAYNAAVTS